jgi:hypothetical protein
MLDAVLAAAARPVGFAHDGGPIPPSGVSFWRIGGEQLKNVYLASDRGLQRGDGGR